MSAVQRSGEALEWAADELEGVAYWRASKATEYPDDERNKEASELASRLASELREKMESPTPTMIHYSQMVSLSFTDKGNPWEDMDRYTGRIGFDACPENVDDYLNGLIRIMEEYLTR